MRILFVVGDFSLLYFLSQLFFLHFAEFAFIQFFKIGKAKSSGHEESNKNDVDEDDGNENVDPSQHQQLTVVLRGVTEAIYLMYITLSPMLTASEDFRPMSEGLAKKLSVTVREMMAVSQVRLAWFCLPVNYNLTK